MTCIVKKIFVITLFLTIMIGTAGGMGYGVKAGLNIANWHGDDAGGYNSRIGFCGGFLVIFGLTDMFVIQPEALYTQKGVGWEIRVRQSQQGYSGVTLEYDYIEIPILFKLVSPLNGGIKPNLLAGPYFAINVNAKLKTEENGISIVSNYTEFVKDIDFGIVLGSGVDFSLKKGKIVLDGRYGMGLTTTSEDSWDLKNRVFSIMLGYSF